MVALNQFDAKTQKLIDELALAHAAPLTAPFVKLPGSVVDFEALMQFDRDTCARYPVFRRRVHPNEFPVLPAGLRRNGAFVTVTQIRPGYRIRVATEGHG